jgi:glutamate-ammonia-ligase adenylyltransferase
MSRRFCVLAFGKLGGRELNYSSDIDLIAMYDPTGLSDDENTRKLFHTAMEKFRADLSRHTPEGIAYRVDLRLRPYGRSGPLVQPLHRLLEYYRGPAGLWEVQALIKARPVAGNPEVGHRFLREIRPFICRGWPGREIAGSIAHMREQAVQTTGGETAQDVKSGFGGIRDVEFLVQGLQLANAVDLPDVLTGSTLEALERLAQVGVLAREQADRLREDYVLLRRVEHAIQVLNDQQKHRLPEQPEEVEALGKRILGEGTSPEVFLETLQACRLRVREAYTRTLERIESATSPARDDR